jgi:thioredoxin 1
MSKITHVNNENFNEIISNTNLKIIYFWAPWCGPCKGFAPIYEAVSEKLHGKVDFVKINVDECDLAAREFNIRSIPTLIIHADKSVLDSTVGALSEEDLSKFIEAQIL